MSRSTARLTVVQPATISRDPDHELTILFAEEKRLLAGLAEIRASLPGVRQRYAAKHGLTIMLPGIDTLRRLFS